MSLIIDALKKTQQLRSKEFKGTPFSNYPPPDKKSRTGLRKKWIVISAPLLGLFIILFVFWKPFFQPLIPQPDRTPVLIKKNPSIPIVEKISSQPPKEIQSPEFTEDQKESPPTTQIEKALSEKVASIEEKKEEPFIKPMVKVGKVNPSTSLPNSQDLLRVNPEPGFSAPSSKMDLDAVEMEKKVKQTKPKQSVIGKASSSTPPASLKEETLTKPIGVEQEGGKDQTLSSDILNQFNLGVSFYNQNEISKAIQAYQKVIEMDPAYIEAYNNLGIIYQEMGDLDSAVKLYQKSIEINPRYEKAYNNLGILLYLKGSYDEAIEAFQTALAINSNNIESYINLGVLFNKKGQWDKAIDSYQKALTINSLHRETHYNIALLYEQLGNFDLAIDHYRMFIQLSSKTHPMLVSKVQEHLDYLLKARREKK